MFLFLFLFLFPACLVLFPTSQVRNEADNLKEGGWYTRDEEGETEALCLLQAFAGEKVLTTLFCSTNV